MKKTYTALFILLLSIQVNFAQKPGGKIQPKKAISNLSTQDDSLLRQTAKMKAEEGGKALLAGDYEKLFNLTHPKVQQITGGKDKFTIQLSKGMKAMEADGFKFLTMQASEPGRIVKVGSQMFVIIPTKVRLQTPQGIFVHESFDIGVSDNKGQTWKLIGGGGNNGRENLRRIFPLAADKLDFPKEIPPYPFNGQ